MIKTACLILLALGLAGCSHEKRYPMEGVVVSLNAPSKSAVIAAGKIDDWMEPMTMEYPVQPDAELAKLHPGDRIQATVVVNGDKYYVTAVRVVPK